MKTTVPKYLVELYNATQAQWDAWRAFVDVTRKMLATRESACTWFASLPEKGTATRCGLHSTSATTYARVAPWGCLSRTSSEYFGVTISLSLERADCDFTTLAEISWD